MYQRINQHDFIDAFRQRGRLDTPDSDGGNFTVDGCRTLFDYLEDLEDDLGEPVELNPIALCCDFAEYDNIEDAACEHDHDGTVADLLADYAASCRHEQSGEQPADEMEAERDNIRAEMLDWLRDRTTVIEIPGTDRIIIQSF